MAAAGHGRGNGLHELLVGRAREFAEQGRAEALVGMPREAARSFTSALKIVAPRTAAAAAAATVVGIPIAAGGGWAAVKVELLMARAQVLSGLGKHEACAQVGVCMCKRGQMHFLFCGCLGVFRLYLRA